MGPRSASAKPASKPTYAAMITQSVAELKERSGSSVSAITKSITVNHGTVNKPALSAALKKMVENGTLTKIKASYKLTKPLPKKKAPVKKQASRVKAATKPKKTITKKKAPAKATSTKKATTKKTATKKTTTARKAAPATKKKATTKTKTTTTRKTRAGK